MGEVFERKSLYARNKLNPDAIVCPDNRSGEFLITREHFSSEAEFRFWKEWSDNDYHAQAKRDNRENEHTVSIFSLSDDIAAIESAEEIVNYHFERLQRGKAAADQVLTFRRIITEKQFRRLWLYSVKGLNQQEIGRMEQVDQRRISKSITAAKKRIKKYLSIVQKRG